MDVRYITSLTVMNWGMWHCVAFADASNSVKSQAELGGVTECLEATKVVYVVEFGLCKASKLKHKNTMIGIAIGHVQKRSDPSHHYKRGKCGKNKFKLECLIIEINGIHLWLYWDEKVTIWLFSLYFCKKQCDGFSLLSYIECWFKSSCEIELDL